MAVFSDLVKQHGSVSAALKAQGYSKGSNGAWTKDSASTSSASPAAGSGSSSKGSSSASKGSGSSTGTSGYYDPNKDYSLAIKNAQTSGADQAYISQLQQERQNKINAQYGGKDPYRGASDIMGTGASGTAGGGWTPSPGYTEEIAADAGLSQEVLDQI